MQDTECFWKPISFGSGYMVSKRGSVVNSAGQEIIPQKHHKGYLKVRLSSNGKTKGFFVHRLVAKAFHDNPNNPPQINHKDGDKQNNYYLNLEWCDASHNIRHAINSGLIKPKLGLMNPRASKLTENEVLEIRQHILTREFTRDMLCRKYGVSVHVVKDIRSNRSWKHL